MYLVGMVKRYLLEAVVDSVDAALAAQEAGADRLELCSGLELGGLSPGPGLVKSVLRQVSIPVHVLLRTRSGDFQCTEGEYETLLAEVRAIRQIGADGVVLGILDDHGHVDVARMQALVREAGHMSVTFHRAFDRVADTGRAAADLAATGCSRLLSSGFAPNASEGAAALRRLREQVGPWIVVMPGGGITPANAAEIAKQTEAVELHFSAIRQDPVGRWVPDADKVRAIRQVLEP